MPSGATVKEKMENTSASAFQVTDERGVRGTLDLTVVPPQGSDSRLVLVRFEDGSRVFADASTFAETETGMFTFPGDFAELLAQNQSTNYGAAQFGKTGEITVPLLAEEINIARRKVLTGGVRVHKTVAARTETVDEPTMREDVNVERVAINQFVTEAPPVRYENDVMIVPLLEEVLVVEKRLVLREEVRISKRRENVRSPQEIVLRTENATLEEITPDANQAGLPPVDERAENSIRVVKRTEK